MNKVKIAFDLDGVLIPDFHQIPEWTEDMFFEHSIYAKPLFHPLNPFDVVTARSIKRKDVTLKWLKQLERQPNNVFLKDNTDETPAEFKYRIAKQQEYKIYVESDPVICSEMEELCTQEEHDLIVMHFNTWIIHTLARY
jgi:FMN phosphatase YigB (HAD superfamily)